VAAALALGATEGSTLGAIDAALGATVAPPPAVHAPSTAARAIARTTLVVLRMAGSPMG
jgi:hypothetical protein